MAERKNHKEKAKAFSEKEKAKSATGGRPKTHLIPNVEWQSSDTLPLRGDVAEALQANLVGAFEHLQRAGQAFQVFLNMSIKAGAAKLEYTWDNGEKPTPEELKEYQSQMEQLQKLKTQQLKAAQEGIAQEAQERDSASQPKTNLITTDGQPLTEENLDNSKKIIL